MQSIMEAQRRQFIRDGVYGGDVPQKKLAVAGKFSIAQMMTTAAATTTTATTTMSHSSPPVSVSPISAYVT